MANVGAGHPMASAGHPMAGGGPASAAPAPPASPGKDPRSSPVEVESMQAMTLEEFLDAHGAKSTLTSFQEAGFDDLESVVRARLDDGMLKRIGLTTLKVRKSVSNALQKLSEQADADRMAALQEEEAAAAKAAALDDKERAERVAEAAEKRARDMRQRASVGNALAAARGAALANPSLRAAGGALSFPPLAR